MHIGELLDSFPRVEPGSVLCSDGKNIKYNVEYGPRIVTFRSILNNVLDELEQNVGQSYSASVGVALDIAGARIGNIGVQNG